MSNLFMIDGIIEPAAHSAPTRIDAGRASAMPGGIEPGSRIYVKEVRLRRHKSPEGTYAGSCGEMQPIYNCSAGAGNGCAGTGAAV